MKKNNHSRKIAFAAAATTSIMAFTSCSDESELIPVSEQHIESNVHSAISIRAHFTEQDMSYIDYLVNLSERIIKEPSIAFNFAQNPNQFINNEGFDGHFNFKDNDGHLMLITALGDKEIREKLESGDLSAFMEICKEKGYAMDYSGKFLKWFHKYKSYNDVYTRSNHNPNEPYLEQALVFPIVAACFVAVYTVYYYKSMTRTKGWDSVAVTDTAAQILLLTEDEKVTYMLCDEYVENEVTEIIKSIQVEYPQLSQEEEIELTNFLKKNIVQINNSIIEGQ